MYYGYCRKSTDAQNETSFEVQAEFLKAQAKKLGEECIILTETGSGSTLADRPVFMKLLSEMKASDILGCYDQSRISRNDKESFIILDSIIGKQARLQVNGKFIDPDDPQDRAIFGMQSIFANYQKDIQLKKSKEGIQKKFANGDAVFAGDTFGYELIRKGGSTHVNILEEEAKIIRYVYKEYAKGRSLHDLERKLYKTPTTRPFDFNINNLRYMIQRPIYMGKYLTVPNMQRHIMKYSRDEVEKALVNSNCYPPIIQEDLWWDCFTNYRTCRAPHAVDYRNRWTKHDLSGVYKCADCGGGVTFHLRKRPELSNSPVYPQYIAQKHFLTCPTKNYTAYRADWLERISAICFFITFLCGGEIGKFFEQEKSALYENTKELRDALDKTDNSVKSVDDRISRLVDAVAEGLLGKDSVKTKMDALNQERTELLAKKKELTDQLNSKNEEADVLLELSAQEIIDTFDDNRRKYYLRYVKEGLNFHDRLELEFMNSKKFIILKPKRNNFRVFPSEVKVLHDGEWQFSFIFDFENKTCTVSEVNSVEEMREFVKRDYQKLLEKASVLS